METINKIESASQLVNTNNPTPRVIFIFTFAGVNAGKTHFSKDLRKFIDEQNELIEAGKSSSSITKWSYKLLSID